MLYLPPHFRESDVAVLQAEIRAIGFGTRFFETPSTWYGLLLKGENTLLKSD